MTNGQLTELCPQCGSAAAVHSISELAAMARSKLDLAQHGSAAGPGAGYAAEPQAGPLPGYAAEPRSGPLPGSRPGPRADFGDNAAGGGLEDAVGDVVVGAAVRFIGRAIGRRVQRTYTERALPAVAAHQETMLREQIAIAERHPDIRACLTDQVIFLAGGRRVLPMAGVTTTLTLQQADALVAQLREG